MTSPILHSAKKYFSFCEILVTFVGCKLCVMKKLVCWNKDYRKRALRVLRKVVVAIALLAAAATVITSVSPIYNFKEAHPFSGPDIYNPYADFDSLNSWKRANFHTHSRIEGFNNECKYWPAEVLATYESLGYDIVTFSNHNEQTAHPKGKAFQSNGYEHGYNLFKYHKLAYGAKDVWHFDHIFPILASQKQFQLSQLSGEADIVQLNHPLRTPTLSKSQLEKLSGYKLIELDSGKSTENEYWDWALSAGHYSFGVANDDLHYPDQSGKIAIRCNFLCTPSTKYEDVLATLKKGCFYSMRLPDYGNGNWEIKREKNKAVPHIKDISLNNGVISIRFSEPASLVQMIGQNHTILATTEMCDSIAYEIKDSDPYVRATAYFPNGEVIYTNPFARYDASRQANPFDEGLPQVNILLTILFNLLLLALCVGDGYLLYKYVIKR